MSTPRLDFWFEFASTYSYPAAMRIGALARKRGVPVRWRPFLLGPIFKAQGWETSPFNLYPDKGRYMWRDLERVCAALDLPFVRPAVFPQKRCSPPALPSRALQQPWGEDFCRAVYAAEFGEGRNIGERDAMAEILRKLGQDAEASSPRRNPTKTKPRCARSAKRRSGSEFSVPRASSLPMANCSGATTGWKPRSTGLHADAMFLAPTARVTARDQPVRQAEHRASGRRKLRLVRDRRGSLIDPFFI